MLRGVSNAQGIGPYGAPPRQNIKLDDKALREAVLDWREHAALVIPRSYPTGAVTAPPPKTSTIVPRRPDNLRSTPDPVR